MWSLSCVFNGVYATAENIIVMLVAAEVMAPASVRTMAPLLSPPAVVVIFIPKPWHQTEGGTKETRRAKRRRRRRKDEPRWRRQSKSKRNTKVPSDLRCQTTQNALCLQFQWRQGCQRGALGFGNAACHSSVSTEMSSSSTRRGEAWGQTDRQTDKPQAAQRRGVETAVTSHRKSLLTGMLHRSDTTKWAFTDPNTQGEKCRVNRRPGAGWELKPSVCWLWMQMMWDFCP